MNLAGTVDTIVLFTVNGYANRLQAMASAALLAQQTGASLWICWEYQDAAPAAAEELFGTEFIRHWFISSDQVAQTFGISCRDIPRYLTVDQDSERIFLAGHDRGEQFFMKELAHVLGAGNHARELFIVAGGQFFIPTSTSNEVDKSIISGFRQARHDFYRHVQWHTDIETEVARQRVGHDRYIGLHLRYTDRSDQAPWFHQVRSSVRAVSTSLGVDNIFVAADSGQAREKGVALARSLGLDPWLVKGIELNRMGSGAGQAAIVDWILLSRSCGMVYFAASTFAEEAAVASLAYSESSGLDPSRLRGTLIKGSHLASAFARKLR